MLFLLLYYLCRFSPSPPGSTLVELSSVWTQLSAICGPHASSVAPMVTHIFQILLSYLTHRNVRAHTHTHTGTRTLHTDTHHVNKRASMLGSKRQALWACHQSQWGDSQGKRKYKWDFISLTRVHNVKTKVIFVQLLFWKKRQDKLIIQYRAVFFFLKQYCGVSFKNYLNVNAMVGTYMEARTRGWVVTVRCRWTCWWCWFLNAGVALCGVLQTGFRRTIFIRVQWV